MVNQSESIRIFYLQNYYDDHDITTYFAFMSSFLDINRVLTLELLKTTETCQRYCSVHSITTADDLAMQGARVSAGVLLT